MTAFKQYTLNMLDMVRGNDYRYWNRSGLFRRTQISI